MTYSTVILCPNDPPASGVVVGYGPDGAVAHVPPGAELPDDAFLLIGPERWTWNAFADRFPHRCSYVTPQEFAGEPTGRDIDVSRFPLLTPSPAEGV